VVLLSITLGSNKPYCRSRCLTQEVGHGCLVAARLAAKDAESAIVARICKDFNMTPALARAQFEQMARYFSDFRTWRCAPGERCYLAVAPDERASRSLRAARCR
jgi:hypothetical protein